MLGKWPGFLSWDKETLKESNIDFQRVIKSPKFYIKLCVCKWLFFSLGKGLQTLKGEFQIVRHLYIKGRSGNIKVESHKE